MHDDLNKLRIPDFLTLLDRFLNIAQLFDQLLIEQPELNGQIEPWYELYEISHHHLLNMAIEEVGFHKEAFEYIFAHDPIKTIQKLANKEQIEDLNVDLDIFKVIRLLYPMLKSKECVLFYNQTIHQLIKKIENGFDTNNNLLQHILSIDKTVIHCKPIQKRIQKAQATSDEKLFRKIANALKPREKPKYSEDATLRFMIYFLMDNGHLQAMAEHERFEALKQFKPKHITIDSFIRKTYRIMNEY